MVFKPFIVSVFVNAKPAPLLASPPAVPLFLQLSTEFPPFESIVVVSDASNKKTQPSRLNGLIPALVPVPVPVPVLVPVPVPEPTYVILTRPCPVNCGKKALAFGGEDAPPPCVFTTVPVSRPT